MSKPEWGTKRMCQSCGAKYYDLQRSPIVCPKCSAAFDPDALLKSRRVRSAPKAEAPKPVPKPEPKPKPAEAADGEEDIDDVTDDDDDNADALIEDASELGDEDDDVSDVVVGGKDEET